MGAPRYTWRRLTPRQREEVLAWRQRHGSPWHAPPHRPNHGHLHFHITAACYEHASHIGFSPKRLHAFSADLLKVFEEHASQTLAWCVLPNHYHALVASSDVLKLLHALGRFHGRTAHSWNGEENTRGRQVFHRVTERYMRSDRHRQATVNYIHHNPVHHGYASLWTDWPWSSAGQYLDRVGRREAERLWRAYPVRDYGKGWDDPAL